MPLAPLQPLQTIEPEKALNSSMNSFEPISQSIKSKNMQILINESNNTGGANRYLHPRLGKMPHIPKQPQQQRYESLKNDGKTQIDFQKQN